MMKAHVTRRVWRCSRLAGPVSSRLLTLALATLLVLVLMAGFPLRHGAAADMGRPPVGEGARMKLFAWEDFWAGGHRAFQADYQQYSDAVAVRFDPGKRPARTEDRIYWAKKPLTVDNHRQVGTLAKTVSGVSRSAMISRQTGTRPAPAASSLNCSRSG